MIQVIAGIGTDHLTEHDLILSAIHLVREWNMEKLRTTDDGLMLAPIEWVPTASQVKEIVLETMEEQAQKAFDAQMRRKK